MESSNGAEFIKTLFENVKDVKFIRNNRKVYKFFINEEKLILNIYSSGYLLEKHEIESNIKYDFDVCSDNEGNIHIVVTNKKYDVQYIRFDGTNLNREKIYYLNNSIGIPSNPKIRIYDGVVYIILSFEQPNSENEWSLRSFVKVNNQWSFRIVDRGPGIFYCQPDFVIENNNVHLIYRYLEKYSVLKYCFFDLAQGWWERPKIIFDDGVDKYKPSIFVSDKKITCVWIEINGQQLYLNAAKDFSENYFKMAIPMSIKKAWLFYSVGHIYSIMAGDKEICWDLCCKKETNVGWRFLIDDKEDEKMAEDVRFFLNVKKEMEFENAKLQERVNELEDTLTHPELSEENENLKEEILQRDKIIGELQETLSSTEQENSQLHEIVARLSQENEQLLAANEELSRSIKENIEVKRENNQFLKRIMGLMKKDA